MKTLYSLLFTLSCFASLFGQESKSSLDRSTMVDIAGELVFKKSIEDRGNKFYDILAFDKAVELYERADTLTIQGVRNYSDALVKISKFEQALLIYSIAINRKDVHVDDYFQYANLLKMNQRYLEADLWMKKYVEKSSTESRALHNKRYFDECVRLRTDRGYFEKRELALNTPAQEFASSFVNGKLVYSAAGPEYAPVIKRYIWTKESFLNMYVLDTVAVNDTLKKNLSPLFNDKYHEGSSAFTNGGKRVYFASNDSENPSDSGVYNLQLYYSDLGADSSWTPKVPFALNNVNYSLAHPWVSSDGKRMFFASDMPGGKGGSDLYTTSLDEKGNWSLPVNLGEAVNTEGDEFFPYFNEKDSILAFSSDGHYGLGGLDIIMVKCKDGEYVQATNFGTPLNSEADDFAAVFTSDMKMGYISSNRTGGKGSDDIYGMRLLKELKFDDEMKEIKIYVFEDDTLKSFGSTVTVTNKETGEILTAKTDSSGYVSFLIPGGKEFLLGAKKIPFLSDSISLKSSFKATSAEYKLNLKHKGPEIVRVDDDIFLKVSMIYFDVNSAKLREDTKDVLDYVVKIMNEFPNIEIELGSHTDCRGSMALNQKLSDQRAVNSAAYIKERINNPNRIHGKGYGETQLTNDCGCEGKVKSTCSDAEHQANRRTEFKIVKGH